MSSINKTARIAGFLYLLLSVIGAFSILYVPSTLFVPGDAAATANNIMASESLFRLGIVSGLTYLLLFISLVLALYKLLRPVNKNHAVLMVILVLVSVPIAMLNELNHFAALHLLSGADYLTGFTADQLQSLMMLFIDMHQYGIFVAQIFWGLWLFPLGYLVFKSGYIPRVIGILLMIGCFGYVIDSFIFFLYPNFGVTVSEFTFLGEILLPLWLLIMGVNVEAWKKRTLTLETA